MTAHLVILFQAASQLFAAARLYLFLQHAQVLGKPFLYILSCHVHHRRRIVVTVIAVKAGVVFFSVRKFHVNGRITRLHQHQVQNQPPGAAVAVDEWVDAL